jgi:hypothetical protein
VVRSRRVSGGVATRAVGGVAIVVGDTVTDPRHGWQPARLAAAVDSPEAPPSTSAVRGVILMG